MLHDLKIRWRAAGNPDLFQTPGSSPKDGKGFYSHGDGKASTILASNRANALTGHLMLPVEFALHLRISDVQRSWKATVNA
jgi:hypothetical protein